MLAESVRDEGLAMDMDKDFLMEAASLTQTRSVRILGRRRTSKKGEHLSFCAVET